MVIAFDSTSVHDYSLKSDTDEVKTVFKIGTLDTPLRLYISDKVAKYSYGKEGDKAEVEYNVNQMNLEAVRFGLRGWENFKDKAGQDVIFSTVSTAVPKLGNREGLSDFVLKKFHPDWITELGEEILRRNSISKEAEKN
jgi:hypothetical protein